jgi:hypothetical protein
MKATKKECLMCSKVFYSSGDECRECRNFPEIWEELIGVFHKNDIDPDVLRDMLYEFLVWKTEDEDDLEFYFGEGKSEKQIDQLFDDLNVYKYGAEALSNIISD